jgi:hypothetical protein
VTFVYERDVPGTCHVCGAATDGHTRTAPDAPHTGPDAHLPVCWPLTGPWPAYARLDHLAPVPSGTRAWVEARPGDFALLTVP